MPNSRISVADALFGKTQRAVLALLFGQPDRSFYLRQISMTAGTGTSQVQKELENLTRAGLILREPRGNQVWFQANRESPVFPELKSLVAKTFGIADVVRGALEPFSSRIRLAFIYGSVARGAHDASSDVDVLIVGSIAPSRLALPQAKLLEVLGRRVSMVVFDQKEFDRLVSEREHFVGTVLSQPRIWLVGSESNLGVVHGVPTGKSRRQKPA